MPEHAFACLQSAGYAVRRKVSSPYDQSIAIAESIPDGQDGGLLGVASPPTTAPTADTPGVVAAPARQPCPALVCRRIRISQAWR